MMHAATKIGARFGPIYGDSERPFKSSVKILLMVSSTTSKETVTPSAANLSYFGCCFKGFVCEQLWY